MSSTESFAHLTLALIEPSLTNPRKTFDATKLAELAESIKASGVHQPVLVRPLPAGRLADTAHQSPRPEFELVSGERRYRACELAGLPKIPAMVRVLSDEQVLEIQLVENLQRDDLQPLEEAEGYDHLIHSHEPPLSVEQVGAKIGKSKSYVYARLRLLSLGTEGRTALREGRLDASRALLIARIPDTKLQAAALGNLFDWQGEPLNYRDAAALLQRQYMLRLSEASFKITDATLVPAAGSCRECPKRTGADPDLFADVKGADVCTDPACFKAKDQAHTDAQLQKAQANGQTIITGREAKSLMPSAWDTRIDGHLRLDDAQDSPTSKPLRALIGKQMEKDGIQPLLVANPHKGGELIAVLPREIVSQLLAAKGYQEQADKVQEDAQRSAKAEAEAIKQKRKTSFEEGWRWRLMEKAWAEIDGGIHGDTYLIPDPAVRYLALQKARALNQDKAKRLCKLLELGTVAPVEAIKGWVADADPHMSLALLTMHEDTEYRPWLKDQEGQNEALLAITADANVSPDAARSEVKAELTDKWKAQDTAAKARANKEKPADTPLNPAAQASGVRGEGRGDGKAKPKGKNAPAAPAKRKPKTSPEEAMQGIAAAMQGKGEEGAPDAGRTESDPDGASAVGEDGRATSPDAGASDLMQGMPNSFLDGTAALWPFPKKGAP